MPSAESFWQARPGPSKIIAKPKPKPSSKSKPSTSRKVTSTSTPTRQQMDAVEIETRRVLRSNDKPVGDKKTDKGKGKEKQVPKPPTVSSKSHHSKFIPSFEPPDRHSAQSASSDSESSSPSPEPKPKRSSKRKREVSSSEEEDETPVSLPLLLLV